MNSAVGVQFPNVPPPIKVIDSICSAILGSRINAVATFVRGPVATIVTGVSLVITLFIITSDAGIATA
ncbi:Uncharacterised protein [Staphylococcus aureus]|nr:Uncharacterised protein [Staphylococcus aureus]